MMLSQVHSITPTHGRRSATPAPSSTRAMTSRSRMLSGRLERVAHDVAELAGLLGRNLRDELHLHLHRVAEAPPKTRGNGRALASVERVGNDQLHRRALARVLDDL